MTDWPLAIAESFHSFITDPNVSDPLTLLNQLKVKSSLLSTDLLDLYFPMQPTLMTVLIIYFILFVFLTIAVFGTAFYVISKRTKDRLYDVTKKYASESQVSSNVIVLGVSWVVLLITTVYVVAFTASMANNYMNSGELAVFKENNTTTSDKFVEISLNSISIINRKLRQLNKFGETDILNKYNNLREMGYEYKVMEPPLGFFLQTIVIGAIAFCSPLFLILTMILMIVWAKDIFRTTSQSSSNIMWFKRASKVISVALTLFALFSIFFSIVLMVYSQVHRIICPYAQLQLQNADIEEYVNSNFAFFDPQNLMYFLNDLASERAEINDSNCKTFIRPMEGLWFCSGVIGFVSVLMGVMLWKMFNQLGQGRPKIHMSQKETFGTLTKKPLTSVFSPMATFR
ncbi:unnamed protein product [Bursaphelenchus okinawaensis]|uniref:Uncharacterized protein n=1 Tax=Bursaphelenchus okinawaensis TaxID=465554 RepID=A0A811K6F0_9BILA|nr:unnamed protein product [Bursaphelenchus okinawaensis]CAG9093251.1 unnamed protein product [Bursaphelenchus okinawaensis]